MPNPWPTCRALPPHARAVLAALHLRHPQPDALRQFDDRAWREALHYADNSRFTLPLRRIARDSMPDWVRERVDRNAAANLERVARIEILYRAIHACLRAEGIDFLALKGLAHCPDFGASAAERVQYDIDLLTLPDRVHHAREALFALGYESFDSMERFPTDHLPPLIRKTGWEWRGDYFDPEIPTAIELHFRLWDQETSRLAADGIEDFWDRRVARTIAGVEMQALARPDTLAFAALHLLKHALLRSVQPAHLLELARFVDLRAADEAFWAEWRYTHPPALRRLQSVALRFAHEWFGCEWPEPVAEAFDETPSATQQWFHDFALSPAAAPFSSAKDELWLHLSLLTSRGDAFAVARRRLLPTQLPGPVSGVHIPDKERTLSRRLKDAARWTAYSASRVRHHIAALAPFARAGARLWWRANALPAEFWTFLTSAVLLNLALFVFVLLFNLRLVSLGYREDFIGSMSSIGTWGCVAGTLPAAAIARRLGLRGTLIGIIAATSILSAGRVFATASTPLLALSFVNGFIFCGWAVIIAPTIAACAPESRRASAFSVFFGFMFATGIAGGWLGGHLPAWTGSNQSTLYLASAACTLAIVPALRLRITAAAPAKTTKIYPRSRFLVQYLVPFFIWCFAIGSFNPFFNVYFQRLHYSAERIGNVFSLSQIAQTAAVMFAAFIFRKAGLTRGMALMMFAASLGLLGLAAQPAGAGAAIAYIGYMVFQCMSEPGMSTILMNNVAPAEREGASALNYLVFFGSQGIAAWVAGHFIATYGYGVPVAVAAAIAAVAAIMFAMLRPVHP